MMSNIMTAPLEKIVDEDSIISNSTSISTTESIIQDIIKNKNIYLITKSIEQRIIEILSYLQSDANLANNKIHIIKYLQSLFMAVEFNSEIFLRKFIKEKEKLNLYKIIINQYIFYTNPGNSKSEEENYRSDLQTLFLLLLSQVTLEKDSYHYILSPLINYLNEKNINNTKKKNLIGNNFLDNEQIVNFKSEHLSRVLTLLKYFYGYYKNEQSSNGILNYYFFNGDTESNITIHNKENPLDNNKMLLNFDETLCVMINIKVLPSEYVKAVYNVINYKLFELKFTEKIKPICFNINIDNQIITPHKKDPLCQLIENETNCIIFKFNKKKTINCEIQLRFKKVESFQIDYGKDKNSKIKEIVLFKNFIGTCSNIIIYKEKKNEGLPCFLLPLNDNNKLRSSSKIDNTNENNLRKSSFCQNSPFPNGIYNEELYSYFTNAELKEDNNVFKDFLNNNMISIYIPNRYMIPIQNEDKTILNTSQIILIDSINGLNAEFNTRSPILNGIHIFNNIYEDDLNIIGGINNILPILELILDDKEFLNIEIFSSFFNLLTFYIFCPKYQNALIKESDSNFFQILSYFLERMPDNFFNNELAENFKAILVFLCSLNEGNYFKELISQFYNYILLNEKILLKFSEENQKNLINQINVTIGKKNIIIDIIKLIRILFNYDRNRKYLFCCGKHSKYFNNNISIMKPELFERIEPIMKLIEIIFEIEDNINKKKNKDNTNSDNTKNKIKKKNSIKDTEKINEYKSFNDNNLYLLFYLLTYDISPCLQKNIILLLYKLINGYTYNKFSLLFDKKKELIDILLFIFKTSFFDVKIEALNLVLLIDKENNWNHLNNNDIKMFIQNEIIPIFLLDEINDFSNKENLLEKEKLKNDDNNKDIKNENKNEIILEKDNDKKEEKVDINKIRKEFMEKSKISKEDLDIKQYGIRKDLEINGIIYYLYSSTETEKDIYKKYNKKKYNILLFLLFQKIFEHFDDADKIFNLIIKIVSNGNLFLITSFISKIEGMVQDSEINKKVNLYNQIVNNNYFLEFILDTYLQFYILINNKNKENNFISGFSLNIYKNSHIKENSEIPYSESDKKDMIEKGLRDFEKVLKFILNEDITKIDYLLTWGKYYEELKEENNIYQYSFDLINHIIFELELIGKKVLTFSESSNVNDIKVQATLYFINIFFEYFTFYKLKYKEHFFKCKIEDINKIIKKDLKYILFNAKKEEFEYNPLNEIISLEQKTNDHIYIKNIFSLVNPIWSGSDNKILKKENEVYTGYINSNVNKNKFNNELEILFYSFNEQFFGNNLSEISNKGMKIIIVIYHLFICFLNIGGTFLELKDIFKDFRLFLLFLITSPSSINLEESIKKKKWPNAEEFEYIKEITEIILFNAIFFFYYKIKEYKNLEKEFFDKLEKENKKKEKSQEDIEKCKLNLDVISSLKKLYVQNIGYFLKILNIIYRGIKADENQNKGFMHYFSNKNKTAERVKKTGAFSLINEIYNECFIKIKEKKRNKLRKNTTIEEKDNIIKPINIKARKRASVDLDKNLIKSFTTKDLSYLAYNLSHNEVQNDINNDDTNSNPDNNASFNSQKDINSNISINDINNIIEKNYLDNISEINFTGKEEGEILLSEEDFQTLENYIDIFLEDDNIQNYYYNHFEERNSKLYTFVSTIIKREKKKKEIIPTYNNIKNLEKYPYDICLMPYYYPKTEYEETLKERIGKMNKIIKEEIKINKKMMMIKEWKKEEEYRNYKKKMFKFKGIWSYEDYFYDTKKYKLKYKIMNHYTQDFTKILMTPITNMDYYLPKFSKFNDELFRNELGENSPISITKVTDICFSKENKIDINDSIISIENKKDENIEINPIYELNQQNYYYIKEIEKKENKEENNLINNYNQKDFDIFSKYIYKKHLYKKGNVLQCEACLIKLAFHIRGIIYINQKEIGFYSYETKKTEKDEDYDADKKTCFGSVFKEKSDKYKTYYLIIPFKKIEFILRRRYYFKKNVLEIFVQNKKSYFFRIDENKYNEFFDNIISNNKLSKYNIEFEDISIETGKNEEKIGLINKSNGIFEYNHYKNIFLGKKMTTIKNIYIKWLKWEISTFTLINYLNLFSGRSYHDVNQYPVFPWIITNYTNSSIPDLSTDNNPSFNNSPEYIPLIRPFNKPMGMIDITKEAKDRKDNYISIFDSNDKDLEENEDRYGSHYSTSLYLTYYLVRVFPFSYLRIEIQGKNFDDPNRLFNSLEKSFECAISQKADLRELIPEFFCFPEMFYNNNDLNLGEIYDEDKKIKTLVNDIIMPPWSSNDAYIFIKYHKEMLESIEISEKIHEWFNIIFGSKQKGKAAKKIYNLFIKQTYDDFDETHKNAELGDKLYQKRMVEFGVTPSQIFKNDLDKRLSFKHLKKPILYDYNVNKGKGNIFNLENEIKIRESELLLEGNPYKIFSSWKKEEQKNEKIILLYKDKVKIISKIEKGLFKKNKSKETKIKEKSTPKKEEKEDREENREENKEDNKEDNNSENKEEINKEEEESEINEEETNEINLEKDMVKNDKELFCPKYRADISQSPTIIYDKGNYIILGGFWNGDIIINHFEDNDKNKKVKAQKNIISTNKISPITIMKMDESETFLICANKMGCIFIYSINKTNKLEWKFERIIQDNQKEITSLDLNENLNIFVTADKEGYINLYTFPQCKLYNSYKINENQLPTNNIPNDNSNNNSSSASRSESNVNISTSQNELYADIIIISYSPLPSIIFYIRSKKCLCVFSINFHFITAKYGIDIPPNGIKKYYDYFRNDYLFIYNKREKWIEIFDIINLDIILRSSKIEYTFIDFCFSKEMERALILVKIDNDKIDNTKDKNIKKNYNYKILMLNNPVSGNAKDS